MHNQKRERTRQNNQPEHWVEAMDLMVVRIVTIPGFGKTLDPGSFSATTYDK